MIFRKGLLFAIVTITLFFPQNTRAEEASLHAELPLSGNYSFKNDPFLLQWTFEIEKARAAEAIADAPMSYEDKVLNRWKAKQSHLWNALPDGRFTINASAYTAAADECGKSDGITASGLKVEENRTLACPPSFPFGTKIAIEGMGEYRCEDRGGAIKGNKIDIYMQTKQEAFSFGRRNLLAEVVK